jgi:hypothetical protein
MTNLRRFSVFTSVVFGAAIAAGSTALAQNPPPQPAERTVYLMQQDQSGCNNADVKLGDWSKQKGTVWVARGSDGMTRVKIGFTGTPDTTYHFFLKCVRLLGNIKTEDEGEAHASFEFPTSSVGDDYGFDMYPEGAPSGNKFQSIQVNFR